MKYVPSGLLIRWRIAKERPYVWYSLFLLVVTILVVWVFPGPMDKGTPTDTRIRLWALALQLMGAWIVWVDLVARPRSFGQGGVMASFWQWAKTLVTGRVPSHAAVAIVMPASSVVGGFGSGRVGGAENATLGQRVANLETNLKLIDSDLKQLQTEVSRSTQQMKDDLQRQVEQWRTEIEAVREQFRQAALGNFAQLLFGAACVMLGTVLSAVAPELAKVAAGQWRSMLALI
jgi:hypothetical protein